MGALLAFAGGGLINVMPGQMNSHRLADCPELVGTLRRLTVLRRRFLHYFCEGQYRHFEGVTATGCHARAYSHGDRVLVVLVNPSDNPAEATVTVDPTVWGGTRLAGSPTVVDLDGHARGGWSDGAFTDTVEPDGLRLLEFS